MSYQGRKGIFTPINPLRYRGNPTQIVYRSSWELRVMKFLDLKPGIDWWASEEMSIPYLNPKTNAMSRYYPDFLVGADGKTYLVEVKPRKMLIQPVAPKNPTPKRYQRYMRELLDWGVNMAKFDAAKKYCQHRGWQFQIFTENTLKISY